MTHLEAKRGAVLAGAILLSVPIAEVAISTGIAGPVHFVVGTLGAVLIWAGLSGRLL
jgi:hypothetical protein